MFAISALLIQPSASVGPELEMNQPVGLSASSNVVEDVPYVWQQINGYCFPSSLSMALQAMGYDLELQDLFAVTGLGFAASYINVEASWAFYAGVLARQTDWFYEFAELHGLEANLYLDSETDHGYYVTTALQSIGTPFVDYSFENVTPLNVMKDSIDAGYPLVIAADLFYLPAEDWDIFRTYAAPLEVGGVAHAITIIGYNDTTHRVQVLDPGIGLNADNYGYPEDGRYNYSMSYVSLDRAWRGAGYATFRMEEGSGVQSGYQQNLAKSISRRLLGNRTAYYQNLFFISAGKDAFAGLGLDMTPTGIFRFMSGVPSHLWDDFLLGFGANQEAFLTMQYYSYREALRALPEILTDYDLAEFVSVAEEALPHMAALSHNDSVKIAFGFTPHGGLITDTFYEVYLSYLSSGNIISALNEQSSALSEIADHALAIADSWERAGNIMASLSGSTPTRSQGNDLTVSLAGGGVLAMIVAAWYVSRRRKLKAE